MGMQPAGVKIHIEPECAPKCALNVPLMSTLELPPTFRRFQRGSDFRCQVSPENDSILHAFVGDNAQRTLTNVDEGGGVGGYVRECPLKLFWNNASWQ